jgi:hypothetical protein
MYKLGNHGDDGPDMSGVFYGAGYTALQTGIDEAQAAALDFTAAAQANGSDPASGGAPSYAAINPGAPAQTVVYPLNPLQSKSGVFVPDSSCNGYGDQGAVIPIPFPGQVGDGLGDCNSDPGAAQTTAAIAAAAAAAPAGLTKSQWLGLAALAAVVVIASQRGAR